MPDLAAQGPPDANAASLREAGQGSRGVGGSTGGGGVGVSKATVSSSRGLTPCLGQPFCKAKAKPTVRFVQHRRLVALT